MVAAIVVLYHPEQEALERLEASLAGQVDHIFFIDNTPGSCLRKSRFSGEGITYIPLGMNRGIAEAQNRGIELSMRAGYSHMLFLDQDSAASPGMVGRMLAAEAKLLEQGERIAAITPQIVDERTGAFPVAVRYRRLGILSAKKIYRDANRSCPEQTDNFISSGSLIRSRALQAIGTMRSDLFIDYVDTEWALRAHTAGFRSFCIPNAMLRHRVGECALRIFGKDVYLYNTLRYRYRIRNSMYLCRLKTMGARWRAYSLWRIPYHLVVYSIFSKRRLSTFRVLLQAMRDGWTGKLGPYSPASDARVPEIRKLSAMDAAQEEHRGKRAAPAKTA